MPGKGLECLDNGSSSTLGLVGCMLEHLEPLSGPWERRMHPAFLLSARAAAGLVACTKSMSVPSSLRARAMASCRRAVAAATWVRRRRSSTKASSVTPCQAYRLPFRSVLHPKGVTVHDRVGRVERGLRWDRTGGPRIKSGN